MSQAGAISNSGGGGGITTVSPGLGISVSTVGSTATVTNTGVIIFVSSEINYTVIQNITIFTTKATQNFFVTSIIFSLDTQVAPNFDGTYAVGWTATAYSDLYGPAPLSGGSFPPENFYYNYPNTSVKQIFIPQNTALVYSCSAGDSGSGFTGKCIIQGFYA